MKIDKKEIPFFTIELQLKPNMKMEKVEKLCLKKLHRLGAAGADHRAKADYDKKTGKVRLTYTLLEYTLNNADVTLIRRNEYAFKKFRQFCIELDISGKNDEYFEETNFRDLSTGFFIALGVSLDDACNLSSLVRYRYMYWC